VDLVILEDHSGSLLSNHVCGSLGVGRRNVREDGGISNTETSEAIDAEAGIDDSVDIIGGTDLGSSGPVVTSVGRTDSPGSETVDVRVARGIIGDVGRLRSVPEVDTSVGQVRPEALEHAEGLAEAEHIGVLGEVVSNGVGLNEGVVGVDLDITAGLGESQIDGTEDGVTRSSTDDLNVGTGIVGEVLVLGTQEDDGASTNGRVDSSLVGLPLGVGGGGGVQLRGVGQEGASSQVGDGVIHKVLTNSRLINDDINTKGAQISGITDSGKLEELGSSDTSSGENNLVGSTGGDVALLKSIEPSDRDGTTTDEVDLGDPGGVNNPEVGTGQVGHNVRLVGVLTSSVEDGHIVEGNTTESAGGLISTVVIRVEGDTVGSSRSDEGKIIRGRLSSRGNMKRSIVSVLARVGGKLGGVVLELLEEGQDVVPVPASGSMDGGPSVVILLVSTDEHLGVDKGSTSKTETLGSTSLSLVPGNDGLLAPVNHSEVISNRDSSLIPVTGHIKELLVGGIRTTLQKKNLVVRVLRETSSNSATSRATANHNVVEAVRDHSATRAVVASGSKTRGRDITRIGEDGGSKARKQDNGRNNTHLHCFRGLF